MDELLDENRLGNPALSDLVRAASVNDGEVGDADKPKDYAEVRSFEVVGLHRGACGVLAAAGDDDGDLLAACKTLEPFGAKGEGLVEADDMVDPCLEHGGDVEVVHRCSDDDLVRSEQLCDELVRQLEGRLVLSGVL